MFLTIIGRCGPFPAIGEACSSYLVESDSGNTKILLDLGSGALSKLQEATDVTKLDAIILSHLHFDPMCDVPVLGYMLSFLPIESMKVICPETPESVKTTLNGRFCVSPIKNQRIGEFEVEFMRVVHPVETYAVKLSCDGKTIVYTGDTNDCEGLDVFCRGADLLLADCGLSVKNHAKGKPHMSPIGCGRLAEQGEVKRLMLTHLSPLNDSKELLEDAQTVFKPVELAQSGMRYRI